MLLKSFYLLVYTLYLVPGLSILEGCHLDNFLLVIIIILKNNPVVADIHCTVIYSRNLYQQTVSLELFNSISYYVIWRDILSKYFSGVL